MTLLLFAAALAADRSGLYLPGAAPFSGAEVTLRGGAIGVDSAPAFLSLHATAALGDRVAVSGSLGMGGSLAGGLALDPLREGTLAARFLVLDGEKVRLAPWVGVGSVSYWADGSQDGALSGFIVGVAGEAGGERAWVDASVPVYGNFAFGSATWGGDAGTLEVLRLSEVGLNFGLDGHNRVRVGMVSFLPNVGWQAEVGMLTGGLTLRAVPVGDTVQAGLLGEIGLSF